MNKILLSFVLICMAQISNAKSAQPQTPLADPFASVEQIHLNNGLNVYLAPSPQETIFNLRVEVDVGTDAEVPGNWGVSHLLEHVLFRDKQLQDEMSYLQVIKEAGGEANGGTGIRITNYTGSIPAEKGPWMLESFAKMLLEPKIADDYVEKEKGTVELERGRPGPLTLALGFNPMDYIHPHYLQSPGFWESEFGIPEKNGYTLAQEQLSTRTLTTKIVQQHYDNYYYPSNMRIYVAGKFDRDKILKIIKDKWGIIPARTGKKLAEEPTPKAANGKYVRKTVSDGTPWVYLGTKVYDASLAEREAISSYMEYLAHRLMKEVRNLKGQTYTANGTTSLWHRYGFAYISFETPKEHLDENVALLRQYFTSEAEVGQLSAEQVQEAKDLYLAKYKLMGKEANSMMWVAEETYNIKNEFGVFQSPFAALANMTPAQFNAALKKHFNPKQSYEQIQQAPLFFAYDYVLMYCVFSISIFFILRKLFTKSFENDKIRWIRKVQFPPLKMLEGFALLFGGFAWAHFIRISDNLFTGVTFLQSSVLFSQYLMSLVNIFALLLICQGILAIIPRKLMVMDNYLVIKSVSYNSKKIALSDITKVETLRWISNPFPASRWLNAVRFRFFFFSLRFWRTGVMIHLKDGRAYYFSSSAPEKMAAELSGFLNKSLPEANSAKAAA